jgi:NAD(P)-dependent dehydrogenase (short-subunit alcohol dehydrogenase family)
MKSFADKIVVITGAGSGIGRALAYEFGRLGARLALNDYSEILLDETLSRIAAQGYSCIHHAVFDVSDEQAMIQFAQEIKQAHGNASVVINNAGIAGGLAPFISTPSSTYKRVMDVNFFGVVHGCKAFMGQLLEEQEGAIVNISSVLGLLVSPSTSDYCASKFAVRGFTEALSLEFHKSPISIHCVHPGGINTGLLASRIGKHTKVEPEGRMLTTPPEDLAKRIIKGIRRNEPRIVYGNQSFGAWLGSKLLPKRLQDKILWKLSRNTVETEDYKALRH